METTKNCPKDAQVMAAILKDMGVSDHEPRVINHMLEFTYRYVTDVLEDGKVYSSHAGKKSVDTDDVKLAIQCKLDHSFTTAPPKDLLMDIAKHKNNNPLPVIKPFTGPKLPPDRYCLSACNYRLRSLKKPKPQLSQLAPVMDIPTITTVPRMVSHMSSGGGKVPVQLVHKPGTLVGGGGAGGIVTVRPSAAVPTPMFRINTVPGVSSMSNMGDTFAGMKRKREDDDYDAS